MATVEPKSLYAVSPAEPQQTYFTVSIAQGGFADSADANGGRVSPCVAHDFATKPTTLAESTKVSRGALRFKKMLEFLQVRSNVSLRNILTTYLLFILQISLGIGNIVWQIPIHIAVAHNICALLLLLSLIRLLTLSHVAKKTSLSPHADHEYPYPLQ